MILKYPFVFTKKIACILHWEAIIRHDCFCLSDFVIRSYRDNTLNYFKHLVIIIKWSNQKNHRHTEHDPKQHYAYKKQCILPTPADSTWTYLLKVNRDLEYIQYIYFEPVCPCTRHFIIQNYMEVFKVLWRHHSYKRAVKQYVQIFRKRTCRTES